MLRLAVGVILIGVICVLLAAIVMFLLMRSILVTEEIGKLKKTNDEQQNQINELKHELEELKQK